MDLRVPLALGLFFTSSESGAVEQLLELRAGPALCTAAWVGDAGEVVTAYHCIVARRRIELRDRDGRSWQGRRVHVDRRRDIAILEVLGEAGPIGLGVRQERLSVGDPVVVWGHASASASEGIPQLEGLLFYSRFGGEVSAVGQELTQLDVAFNPGISGGPVLDGEGQMAAVASRKMKGEHLSFASPLHEVWMHRSNPGSTRLSGQLNVRLDVDLPVDVEGIPSIHLTPQLVVWDWLLVEAGVGTGLAPTREVFRRGSVRWRSGRAGVYGRLRVGSGPQSLSVDLGPAWTTFRHLSANDTNDTTQLNSRQGETQLGAVVHFNWRGWTLGVSWEEESSWSMSFGKRLLSNLILF